MFARGIRISPVAALLSAAAGLLSPANAQTIGSSYTSTAPQGLPHDRHKPGELDGSTTRLCPGVTVSVGRNRAAAAKEFAAQVWFGPFNPTSHTVEWRAADGWPFAIIQRWPIADNGDPDKSRRADRQTAD